ncbi:MAG: hypothetical protein PVI01_12365 [Gemmatimonadales bacterium]
MRIEILRQAAVPAALVAALLGGPVSRCMAQAEVGGAAVTTRVMVRAVARDAKVIGSGVGGALIRIVDAESGDLLAEGRQEGGTGDTDLIMGPHARGMTIYDTEGTAGFLAELRLSEPTVVNISTLGPLGYPQAIRSATKQLLLIPGHDIDGDGVILQLYGFIVEILSPEPLAPVSSVVEVTARVRMMCGCTIEPGGLWDADDKEVVARLKADGEVVSEARLRFAGRISMFEGSVPVPDAARGTDLELEVIVSEAGRENFGRHAVPLGAIAGGGGR